MPRIAKFDYSDYSLLDSLYAQTGIIPTYSAISNEIASIIPGYVPSGTIIAKYRNSWLSLRGLDSKSAVQTIERISGERSSLVQQFQNIVSELETVEKNVTSVLSTPSEIAFLEQKNEQLELQNQKLIEENAFLKGQIDGFQKALDHVSFLLQQRDLDILSKFDSSVCKFQEFLTSKSELESKLETEFKPLTPKLELKPEFKPEPESELELESKPEPEFKPMNLNDFGRHRQRVDALNFSVVRLTSLFPHIFKELLLASDLDSLLKNYSESALVKASRNKLISIASDLSLTGNSRKTASVLLQQIFHELLCNT